MSGALGKLTSITLCHCRFRDNDPVSHFAYGGDPLSAFTSMKVSERASMVGLVYKSSYHLYV